MTALYFLRESQHDLWGECAYIRVGARSINEGQIESLFIRLGQSLAGRQSP